MSDMDKQLKRLFSDFNRKRNEIERDIDKIVSANLLNGSTVAKRKAPKAFGKLAQSIGIEKTRKMQGDVVVTLPYAPFVEFGTGAKVSVPQEWANYANEFRNEKGSFEDALKRIEDWCKLKGKPQEAAYPILITILEDGLRPQPFMYPAFQETKRRFKADLERYVQSR